MLPFETLIFAHAKNLPRLEASLLLGFATHSTREKLITRNTFSNDEIEKFIALSRRRNQGEPIAYILGHREFFGRNFIVTPDVLIPRPETELLVDTVLEKTAQTPSAIVLELGTGSGCIAISLALENPALNLTAVDFSTTALDVAQANARALHAQVTWLQSDWFTNLYKLVPTQKFDVIVSNPPYIAQDDSHLQQGDLRFEPQHALHDGANGLQAIKKIIQDAPTFLTNKGWLLLEHGYQQGAAVREQLAQHFVEIQTLKDLANLERVTLGRLKS